MILNKALYIIVLLLEQFVGTPGMLLIQIRDKPVKYGTYGTLSIYLLHVYIPIMTDNYITQ